MPHALADLPKPLQENSDPWWCSQAEQEENSSQVAKRVGSEWWTSCFTEHCEKDTETPQFAWLSSQEEALYLIEEQGCSFGFCNKVPKVDFH